MGATPTSQPPTPGKQQFDKARDPVDAYRTDGG